MSLTQSTTSLKPKDDPDPKPEAPEIRDELPSLDFSYYIKIMDETVAHFQSISGMTVSRGVDPLVEGGKNDHTFEFPTGISYGQITFQKGVSSSDYFWKWMSAGQFGGWVEGRNFELVQYNSNLEEDKRERRWNFYNAFPVKWELGEMSTLSRTTVTFERLVLSFDYFELAS